MLQMTKTWWQIYLYSPYWSYLVQHILFCLLLSYSVQFSPNQSTLVLFRPCSPIQSILSILVYSVNFSPIKFILSTSVQFDPIWSTLVLFGPFGFFSPLWSYSVLFSPLLSYLVLEVIVAFFSFFLFFFFRGL